MGTFLNEPTLTQHDIQRLVGFPDSCSSYPPGENFHISNQVFRLGMEEESLNETNLGGMSSR